MVILWWKLKVLRETFGFYRNLLNGRLMTWKREVSLFISVFSLILDLISTLHLIIGDLNIPYEASSSKAYYESRSLLIGRDMQLGILMQLYLIMRCVGQGIIIEGAGFSEIV